MISLLIFWIGAKYNKMTEALICNICVTWVLDIILLIGLIDIFT